MPFVQKFAVAQSAFCSTTAPCTAVANMPASADQTAIRFIFRSLSFIERVRTTIQPHGGVRDVVFVLHHECIKFDLLLQ